MRDAYVELARVSKRFGVVEAVSGVSLAVPEGQITTLLGPSGCGKTTLLRLIAGFMEPDEGDIRIKGLRVNGLPPQRRTTAIVFQDYALFPHLSVFENVAYGLRRRRIKGPDIVRRVQEILTFVGLTGQERVSPLRLSGGQQQRVALARALVVEPDVLLLDEPLSSLDAKLRTRVRTELKEIQQSLGKTTILVTHDQEFVADFIGIANLVPATVRVIAGDGIHLESLLGPLTVPRNGPCVEGQAVTLLIRPTAFSLWARTDVDRVPVTVRSTSFLGGVQRHHVEIGALRLVVDQPLGGVEELRSRMWLAVDAAAVYLLPAQAS